MLSSKSKLCRLISARKLDSTKAEILFDDRSRTLNERSPQNECLPMAGTNEWVMRSSSSLVRPWKMGPMVSVLGRSSDAVMTSTSVRGSMARTGIGSIMAPFSQTTLTRPRPSRPHRHTSGHWNASADVVTTSEEDVRLAALSIAQHIAHHSSRSKETTPMPLLRDCKRWQLETKTNVPSFSLVL